MTQRFVHLAPVSRASVRLTDGQSVETLPAPGSPELGSGPQCPCCTTMMRPLPDKEPAFVRCENSSCAWFMAPFKSTLDAVRSDVRATEVMEAI